MKITPIEEAYLDVWVELAQAAQLAILPGDETLLQRGELDVEIELWQVEVRGEHLGDPVAVPFRRERGRLVVPLDPVEIEDVGELRLTRMGELRVVCL